MKSLGIKKILKTLTKRWFSDEFIDCNIHLVNQRLEQVLKTDPKIFLNVFKIYAKTEIFNLLKKINKPTLLLTGENDLGCSPKHNKFMADQIPGSKLVIIPRLKHSILIESPKVINQHLIAFLKK